MTMRPRPLPAALIAPFGARLLAGLALGLGAAMIPTQAALAAQSVQYDCQAAADVAPARAAEACAALALALQRRMAGAQLVAAPAPDAGSALHVTLYLARLDGNSLLGHIGWQQGAAKGASPEAGAMLAGRDPAAAFPGDSLTRFLDLALQQAGLPP
ncbi:hypothetical protein ACEYYA_10115 [Paracoccus sp. p3-h83]|uniref:hypothetical protein n=1 Tax=Paracoccus sp. p3-h83 TaxID=3342805 RepID=UPI0035B87005